jgi:FkbM family methyltransferase
LPPVDALPTILLVAVILLTIAFVGFVLASGRCHALLRRRLRDLQESVRTADARADRVLRHVYASEIRSVLAAAGRHPRFEVRLPSQFGEDAFLWDLFEGKLDGFFVEVGAYDGVALSATYALEAAGWTGLLVEPLPDRARQCEAARPGSRTVCAAVSRRGSSGTTVFRSVAGGTDRFTDMVSGIDPRTQHEGRIERLGGRISEIEVPLFALADLLADHAGPIDVAVIDVEGAEADVIDGLDLAVHRPRVLLVEDLTFKGDGAVMALFAEHGYREAAALGHNRVYIDTAEPALIERAGRLAGRIAPGDAPVEA